MKRQTKMNNRRCDNCSIDVPRASYAKKNKKQRHLENIRQDDIIIPEWLFKEEQEPIRKKNKKSM